MIHQDSVLILLILVGLSSLSFALPYQTIELDPSDVSSNLNVSWTDTCPGGKTECFPGETCCPLKNQGYGCCPYKEAVCCEDQASCCPKGTKCDIVERICNPTSEVFSEKLIKY